MKITSLKIERFGVWEGLNLPKVSRGLNVFYGPNEAGKTTLMQFVRACLYGGADDERARYIQMALDGKGRRFAALPVDSASANAANSALSGGSANDGDAASELSPEVRRVLDAARRANGADSDAFDAKSAARDPSRSWVGGSATVTSDFGEHRLERRYIRRDAEYRSAIERKSGFLASEGLVNWSGRFYSLPGRKIAESLVVTGPDGARVGDYFAKTLTCNLDEGTFNGVFAIGLDELQRLGMLNETEAAQMLYRLSVGVDRGAFVQVFQQIVAERNDLFDVKGKPSIVENLLAERDKARRKSSETAADLREYARLLEERRAVLEATNALRDRLEKATRQKRLRELALQVAPGWDERNAIRAEIDAMGDVPAVEQSAVDECELLIAAVDETAAKIKEIKNSYRTLRDERDALEIDPALEELAPRVSILENDLPRLREIDAELDKHRAELADATAKLDEEEARVKSVRDGKIVLTPNALDAVNATLEAMKLVPDARFSDQNSKNAANPNAPKTLPNKLAEAGIPFKEVEDFKIPARAVRRRRLKLAKYREELERVRKKLAGLVDKLEQGLTSRQQKNLTEAIERTGALLSALRRRVEIERRVAEMSQYRKELERQNKTLADNQSITGAPLYALGAGVVVGGLLFGLALFGKMELAVGLLGLLALIACVFYKTTVEKKNYQKLEDNQRRLGLLLKQLEQAQAESKSIDDRFPAPANSTATLENRLQKAKADLAFFEALAPVEASWRETTKLLRAEEARVQKAETALKKARKRWAAWLREACLPANLNPTQVRDVLARVGLTEDLRREIDGLNAEIDYLIRERRGIFDRFASAVSLLPKLNEAERNASPFELAPILRGKLDEHAQILNRRAELSDEMTARKKKYRKLYLARRERARAVRKHLAGYRVKRLAALVAAVERYSLFLRRNADLDAAQKRLDAGIGDFCPEAELSALLAEPEVRAEIPVEIANLTNRLEGLDAELRGKLELSGRLSQQAEAVAAKKEGIRTRFEAAALDLRIAEMTDLWQSRAVSGRILEDVRRAYERERQPETLREASRYLRRLTEGRYVNIWTPLGEDALFVDAADGETLDVAALSRGTREQLFIAIRLALVVSFEKHGIQMPLVLDDVLVNFDVKRAATAAKLLCDFVKGGRQVFLFTCHLHICRLFLGLQVPVCVLPSSNDPNRRGFRVLLPPKAKKKAEKPAPASVSIDGAATDSDVVAATNPSDAAPAPFEIVAPEPIPLETENAPTDAEPETPEEPAPEIDADAEKSRKPYFVVAGSDEAADLRLSDEAEELNVQKSAADWNLSVAVDEEKIDEIEENDAENDVSEPEIELESTPEPQDAPVETAPETEILGPAETFDDDFSRFSFSTNAQFADAENDDDSNETAAETLEVVETLKNASLDGEKVELKTLSEISPTFSTVEPSAETPQTSASDFEFEVVEPLQNATAPTPSAENVAETLEVDEETAANANVAVAENDDFNEDSDDGDDYTDDDEAALDEIESVDYDEWATVFLAEPSANPFAESSDSNDGDDAFLNYFNENDADAENADEDDEFSENDADEEEDDYDYEDFEDVDATEE